MAEESKERLSNPTYALALKQLGYEIPEKYINSTMKEEYTEKR